MSDDRSTVDRDPTRPGLPARIDPGHGPRAPRLADSTLSLMAAIWADLGARTRTAYEKDYRAWAAFLGTDDPEAALDLLLAMAPGDANAAALAWRASMQESGLSPATIARRLAALKTAVKRARIMGRVTWALEVPGPKVERFKDVRGPGLSGFGRMLAELDRKSDPKSIRDRAILRLLWGLALRRGELVALDYPRDVDLDGDRLAVLGKGRSDREWLTLPAGARTALEAWLTVRGREAGPLFKNAHTAKLGGRLTAGGVYQIVRGLGVSAGLDRPTRPHGIRHASITELTRRTNGNVIAAQRFARHKDPATTGRYVDEVQDEFGRAARMVDDAIG